MSKVIRLETISEMSATYPDVPLAPGVDLAALGDDPLFVTLPIGKFGAKSVNGRTYEMSAVQRIVEQVNSDRPEGRWGHLKPEDRASKYDAPPIRWVGATIAPDGVAYGKLLAVTQEARDYYRTAKATNAKVATSVYGVATFDGTKVVDFELESIDIADPKRVGIPDMVAAPQLTQEMEEGMKTDKELVQELSVERDQLQKQIAEMKAKADQVDQAQKLIQEYADAFVRAEINITASGGDLGKVIQEMIEKLQAMQASQLVAQVEAAVQEMVKVETLRPIVTRLLNIPAPELFTNRQVVAEMFQRLPNEKAIKDQIVKLMAEPYMAALATQQVQEQAGPGAVVAAADKQKPENWREELVKNAEQTAKQIGALK